MTRDEMLARLRPVLDELGMTVVRAESGPVESDPSRTWVEVRRYADDVLLYALTGEPVEVAVDLARTIASERWTDVTELDALHAALAAQAEG